MAPKALKETKGIKAIRETPENKVPSAPKVLPDLRVQLGNKAQRGILDPKESKVLRDLRVQQDRPDRKARKVRKEIRAIKATRAIPAIKGCRGFLARQEKALIRQQLKLDMQERKRHLTSR